MTASIATIMHTDQADRRARRSRILEEFGATSDDIRVLLAYNDNIFDFDQNGPLRLPLASEPFAETWRSYVRQSEQSTAVDVLRDKLVQLNFPIREGISQTDEYRSATRRGVIVGGGTETPSLEFREPDQVQLTLHATAAGEIPILSTSNREDFAGLVSALAQRNEPLTLPDSMGAVMVAGLNNWDRVRQYRVRWEETRGGPASEAEWKQEFSRIIPQKELYQDKLVILSDGCYSNVDGNTFGMADEEWRRTSLVIRREHECTHYFTRRVLHSMRNNLLDEIIADYMGIVAAAGAYRPDWFLHFMGLEGYPAYRRGGRLENYGGEEPFSESAFGILTRLVKSAAENLADFDKSRQAGWTLVDQAATILTLCFFTLEELASSKAPALLTQKRLELRANCSSADD